MTRKQLMQSLKPLDWGVVYGTSHTDLEAIFIYDYELKVRYKIRDIQNKEGKYSLFFCLSGRNGVLAAVCIKTHENIYELQAVAEFHRIYLLSLMFNLEH